MLSIQNLGLPWSALVTQGLELSRKRHQILPRTVSKASSSPSQLCHVSVVLGQSISSISATDLANPPQSSLPAPAPAPAPSSLGWPSPPQALSTSSPLTPYPQPPRGSRAARTPWWLLAWTSEGHWRPGPRRRREREVASRASARPNEGARGTGRGGSAARDGGGVDYGGR